MRNFAKIVSLVLIMALFIMILPVPPVYAEEELKEYSIKLVETDMLDQSVSVFLSDGKIMMSITDVARITRCELTQESDVYTLKHAKGFRTIELDARQQTLTENGENWNTYIVEHNGTILVPAYMILTYLGAYCSIDSSNSCLSVYMPLQTFWETLTFTSEQKMNIISYSDTTKNVNVVCDLIIDFIAPVSGQSIWSILFKGVDESTAVYAALEADIYKYESVQASTQTRTQKLNDLAKFFSVADDIQETGFDMLFFANDANKLQAYKSIYSLNGRSNQLESYINFQDTIKNRESFKQVYDGAGTKIDASLLLIDIFTTVMDRLQFTDTLKNSLINTFSTKTLKTAGNPVLNDPYLDAAQEVSKTLSSTTSTITNTIFEKATDFVMDKSLTWGLETTVKAFGVAPSATVTTSVGSTALLSVTLGGLAIELIAFLPIGKYTPFGQIPASQADLMAIMTSDYYDQTWLVFNGLVEKAEKEEYHNPETMQMLYDSYMILLRFSLVHFESRIKYAESQYIVPSAKSDYQNRADAIAKTIDQLNHCSPAAIPKLSDLEGQSTSFDDAMRILLNERDSFSIEELNNMYSSKLNEYYTFVLKYNTFIVANQSTDFENWEEPWSTIGYQYPTQNPLENFGYAYKDIDNNGTAELILFRKADLFIYAIFTFAGGEPTLLGSYWERNYCTLDDSAFIYENGSGGAWDSWTNVYQIAADGKSFELMQTVGCESVYESEIRLEEPGYYITTGSEKVVVSQEEANQVWSKYPDNNEKSELVFIPIITPSITPTTTEPNMISPNVQILTGQFQGIEWGDFMHVSIKGDDGVDYSFFVLQSFDIDLEAIKIGQAVKVSWQNSDVQLGDPFGIQNVDQIIDIELLEPVL